ncbi:MAG: hypothetical protein M1541_20120, partial [Acidobacteria bacterium]|nr:hypothetical protein [Acidobacteriota bacterium]
MKSAALPLLGTVPVGLVLKRRRAEAAAFLGVAGAVAVLWNWWAVVHRSPTNDLISLYYHDYLGFYLANVSLADLPIYVVKNAATFVRAFG